MATVLDAFVVVVLNDEDVMDLGQMDLNVIQMKAFFQHVLEGDLFEDVLDGFLGVYHYVHVMVLVNCYEVTKYQRLKFQELEQLVVDQLNFVLL